MVPVEPRDPRFGGPRSMPAPPHPATAGSTVEGDEPTAALPLSPPHGTWRSAPGDQPAPRQAPVIDLPPEIGSGGVSARGRWGEPDRREAVADPALLGLDEVLHRGVGSSRHAPHTGGEGRHAARPDGPRHAVEDGRHALRSDEPAPEFTSSDSQRGRHRAVEGTLGFGGYVARDRHLTPFDSPTRFAGPSGEQRTEPVSSAGSSTLAAPMTPQSYDGADVYDQASSGPTGYESGRAQGFVASERFASPQRHLYTPQPGSLPMAAGPAYLGEQLNRFGMDLPQPASHVDPRFRRSTGETRF